MSVANPQDSRLRRLLYLQRWAIWEQPARTMTAVLAVEGFAAAAAVVLGLGTDHAAELPRRLDELSAALGPTTTTSVALTVAAVAHTEIVRAVERSRRAISVSHGLSFLAVWTLAAPLLLPVAQTAVVIVIAYAHSWWRSWRVRTPLYRTVFTASTVLLAACAAIATRVLLTPLVGAIGAVPIVAAALLVYTIVNQALVVVVVRIANPEISWSTLLGSGEENMLELATLCLGALTAAAVTASPVLIVAVLGPLVLLQRAALVRQLRVTAESDPKTGLLTPAAWHTRAERLLAGAGQEHSRLPRLRRRASDAHDRVRGVLMCDLDRFKRVNDRYGHLAGDHALRAVATVLRSVGGPDDLIARFGGEEFLVLLVGGPAGSAQPVLEVAELIRCRVAALRVEVPTVDGPLTLGPLTVSIGAVELDVRPAARVGPLAELIQAADSAMYSAKRAGRDQVRAAR